MYDYRYTIKDNTVQVINSEQELMVYDFGSWESGKVAWYRALLAMKKDMEYAEAYLNQMLFEEDTSLIDGALINSSIQLLVKCFSNPSGKSRRNLDSNKVFRIFAKKIGEEDLTKQFSQFYDARNRVISHDQINYAENIVGLTVNRLTGYAEDIVEITIRTRYLFEQNQRMLLRMVDIVLKYLDCQIRSIKSSLIEKYNQERPVLGFISCENIPMATEW